MSCSLFCIVYGEPLFEHFRECIVMLSQNLTKWTQYSPLVQQKLLTKGLLFVEIRAVELLISSLANEVCNDNMRFRILLSLYKGGGGGGGGGNLLNKKVSLYFYL